MSAFLRQAFEACAAYAMPHRPIATTIAHQLMRRDELAEKRNHTPFVTITNLTESRGRQHRNTARDAIRELETLGFIKIYPARLEGGKKAVWSYRFRVVWSKVRMYFGCHPVLSMSGDNPDPGVSKAAEWDKQRKEREKRIRDQAAARAADEVEAGESPATAARNLAENIGAIGPRESPQPAASQPGRDNEAPDPEERRRKLRELRDQLGGRRR